MFSTDSGCSAQLLLGLQVNLDWESGVKKLLLYIYFLLLYLENLT